MRLHRPGQGAEVKRDAAKPCVRVNEAVAAKGDEQMMLRRSWHDEQEIASRHRSGRIDKACSPREGQISGDAAVSQRVALGRLDAAAQRTGDQSEAIHARHSIAPAEAKWCAQQRFGFRSEFGGRHRGIG